MVSFFRLVLLIHPVSLADLARKHIDFLERTGLPIPAPTTHESL